jgi:Starter unit:ACP transacylase in aflatoxin biosynthesis
LSLTHHSVPSSRAPMQFSFLSLSGPTMHSEQRLGSCRSTSARPSLVSLVSRISCQGDRKVASGHRWRRRWRRYINLDFLSRQFHSCPKRNLQLFTHVPARQHSEGGRPYPSSSDSFLCGICTGALASAAISSSRSLLELIPAAVHAVIIAFRAGLCASEVRSSIEDISDHSPEWSIVVSGISTEAATRSLKEFADSKVRISLLSFSSDSPFVDL